MIGLCSCFAWACNGVGFDAVPVVPAALAVLADVVDVVELGGLIVVELDVEWVMGNEAEDEDGEILVEEEEDEGVSLNGAGTTWVVSFGPLLLEGAIGS